MVWKIVEHRVHVDERRENLWGGLPQKRDIINEKDREAILKWWETATTISPI